MNQAISCRVLSGDQEDVIKQLIKSRSTFVGVPRTEGLWVENIQNATLLELRNLLLLPPHVCLVMGAYRDSNLIGVLITFTSPNQACWMIRTAYVAPSSSQDVIATLLDSCASVYEGLGFKRFLAMYTEDSHRRYTRLNHRTSIMNRYVGNTECVNEANVRPKFLDYWEYLYGRMLFPVRTVVRSFNLVDDTMSTFHPIREAQ